MVFDSFVFLFRLLPLILILYYLAPEKMKNFILILGSLVFYAWEDPKWICLLLGLALADYILGRLIEVCQNRSCGGIFLAASVALHLGILFWTGYSDVAIPWINHRFGLNLRGKDLEIPVGIFLYTLRALSYLADVYRKEVKAQKNFPKLLLYLIFFLQFPAGNVWQYRMKENQLSERKIDICAIQRGTVIFVKGLAKKVLLADNLLRIWQEVSVQDFAEISLLAAWIGILVFGLGIYYEFAGIAEMARGTAAFFGFSLAEDFKNPYSAVSVTDFWEKWYFSLGDWFREYVCRAFSGKSGKKGVQMLGILTAWFLLGLWSGRGLHFLCWGLWFAFFLMLESLFIKESNSFLPHFAGRIYTFAVVMAGWILFAFENFRDIVDFARALLGMNAGPVVDKAVFFGLMENRIILSAAVVFCLPVWKRLEDKLQKSNTGYGAAVYRFLQKGLVAVLLLMSLIYMTAK